MAQAAANDGKKKLIRIDISSDTVCPWCFVGKKNLDKAIETMKGQCEFELRWHPFFLDPSAPKEGINKKDFYFNKFGPQSEQMYTMMAEIFSSLGLKYTISGLTGSTLDSHRLIYFAGQQGLNKQHNLVEELGIGYFTQGKYIGDRDFLLECAQKAGVEGAAKFLDSPNNGVKEVYDELQEYSSRIKGVPHYVIDGNYQLNGGQPPESFLRALKMAASEK